MATESVSDEWMYNEVLDDEMPEVSGHRRISIDSTDLLDDVLTFPASSTGIKQEVEPEVDLSFVHQDGHSREGSTSIEDSGSARYNAEQVAKTVQARIESNKTSQSIAATQYLSIYSREPNRRNSVYIGNMTWWTTDIDVLNVVREAGLGEIKCLKFFENRTNGQSKGYAIAELANEATALGAPDKLQGIKLYDKTLTVLYAGRMTATQFEAKCQGKEGTVENKPLLPTTAINNKQGGQFPLNNQTTFRPPLAVGLGGFPPTGFPPVPSLPPELPFNPSFPPTLPRPPPLPPQFDPAILAFAANNKPPGNAHLNPAFLQDHVSQGNNVAELFAKAAAHFQGGSAINSNSIMGGPPPVVRNEEEIADANQRNRAISSSAISRAMSDANAGDYDSAVDTLKMAITLIKQSITAGSESCQMLIQSLLDCLHSVEYQSSGSKRSKSSHDRHDGRGYDGRDRSSRSHRSGGSSSKHRDRSRERRR